MSKRTAVLGAPGQRDQTQGDRNAERHGDHLQAPEATQPFGQCAAIEAQHVPCHEQHLPGGQGEVLTVADIPRHRRFFGIELVRQPPQPRRNEHPVPLADRQQQQHQRRGQQQQRVHRQDVGAVVGVVQRGGGHDNLLERVDTQAKVASGPQRDVGVQVKQRKDDGQGDRRQIQRARAAQRFAHGGGEPRAVAFGAVGLAHDETADEDEAFGGRDVEAISAGDARTATSRHRSGRRPWRRCRSRAEGRARRSRRLAASAER